LGEFLVRGREREYLTYFFREYAWAPDGVPAAHVEAYIRAYSQPGGLRGSFAYYTEFGNDIARNRESAKDPLTIPVLALGGYLGTEIADEMRRVATDVRGEVIEKAGHWLPEEQPDKTAEHFAAFFASS
jgi:pimeloyl-ACP methyl ester carboxylesterase